MASILPNLSESFGPMVFLAQADGQPQPPGLTSLLPGIILIGVFFYFLILRPQKNREQTMRDMIANLKEKDRVVTIGGIHGVVTNVQRDRDEVTIRVDESTGAKLRVNSSAIARVVVEETKSEN